MQSTARRRKPKKAKSKTLRTDPGAFVVDLHGLRADGARSELDRVLNQRFMAGCSQGRVICGLGTGALMRAIGHELAVHPLVMSHEQDHPGSYRIELASGAAVE